MASNGSIFFAGVGTTFLILGAGFGSGMFMANSALKPSAHQAQAPIELPAPIRVVLPSSAQAAEPKTLASVDQPAAPAQVQLPQKEVQATSERIEKAESGGSQPDRRKRRQAERRARRLEARQVRREIKPVGQAPILAFGGDEPPAAKSNFNLFGN